MLQAFEQLAREVGEAHLLVAGDGRDRAPLAPRGSPEPDPAPWDRPARGVAAVPRRRGRVRRARDRAGELRDRPRRGDGGRCAGGRIGYRGVPRWSETASTVSWSRRGIRTPSPARSGASCSNRSWPPRCGTRDVRGPMFSPGRPSHPASRSSTTGSSAPPGDAAVPTWLWIVVALVALVLLGGIWIYNRLVKLRARVNNGWSQIDVQLRRRYDLIPNLVTTAGVRDPRARGVRACHRGAVPGDRRERCPGSGAGREPDHARDPPALRGGRELPRPEGQPEFPGPAGGVTGTESKIASRGSSTTTRSCC